ncbi:transglycosylase domain-containing protein [Paenarthrobacter nitroguajacolicus]|uniref:transglycosylase domain-containing protein n=1 Tax=Paenarthrobacter nitroguajacolicus TaxID=211146 RepID=UPI002859494F|nr:transglycosylase domain-containing protein [Paenarthrobacter nitroguajacolicus]MDR6639130.1 membrane peptidoglycan carboxypeptidase [Paenarthrobacter nitroguajacolicus]
MARNKGRKPALGKVLLRIFGFFSVSILCGVLISGFVVPVVAFTSTTVGGSIGFYESLPSELNVDSPSLSSTVVTADGQHIATFYAENRVKVPLEEMSPFIREAIVAIEDSRFYEHPGVDAQGIMRALTSNLTKGTRQGASTLTQQYVTNVLNESRLSEGKPEDVVLSGEKTMGDKLREIKLALELEKRFSKDQILEGYLNIVFFNRNAYGIEAASRYFFSTSAKDLTLPQAALLAGLVNGPSIYDPTVDPEAALTRRNLVLDRMLEQGKITAVDHGVAVATPVELNVTPSMQGCAGASIATYFCDYVSHLILNNEAYGSTLEERERLLYRGGLTITTTLDSRLQAAAQKQVDASAGDNPDKWGAAMTTVQPGTGKILAMAQNTVFVPEEGKYDTQLNFNVDAKDENGYDLNGAGGFQPGSTMKPFIYAEWLNEGKNPTAVVDASRRVYPVGFPWRDSCGKVLGGYSTAQKAANLGADDDLQNNDPGYYRPMPINYGLYNSINTATFATAAQLDFCGIQRMVDTVGLHSGLDNAPVNMHQIGNLLGSIGVAPVVLASAYATFANDGTYCAPIAITEITDAQGRQYEAQEPECRDAVKPAVARGVNAVLQDVLKMGSGVYIEPKVQSQVPVAAKTGTSNNNGATWVAGFTTALATASFFGDTSAGQQRAGQNVTINGKFYKSLDGYMIAGPQWANYMMEATALYPSGPFPAPAPPPPPAPVTTAPAAPR